MLFFKRILKEPKPAANAGQPVERRSAKRYIVSPQFPLRAILSFAGRLGSVAPMDIPRLPWKWPGRLLDCSAQGARIQMGPTEKVQARDLCDLRLRVDDFELTVPCLIANIRETAEGVVFGLKLELTDAVALRAYGQLLEVLALGSTLKLHGKGAEPDDTGYLAEHYTSSRPARLSVWRHPKRKSVVAFEFQLKDSLVRAVLGQSMEILSGDGADARPAPVAHVLEIQRLFNWVLPNLSPAVPADVREFLANYAG